MVKALSGLLPLWQLSLEGCLHLCSDWVYWYAIHNAINNFTMLTGVFIIYIFLTHLPIGALLCEALENHLTDNYMCGVHR
jgi:hypothetical protein